MEISIIVPIYNVEHYLNQCVESILAQTFTDFELILVDDGSPDNCPALCDAWAQKDSRIRVIHKENGGLSDARNAGLEIANGAWYMFVDSDDTVTPDTAERLYRAAVANGCEIAVCNMVRIYDDGTTEPFYHPADEPTVLDGAQRFETLRQPSVCNKLFRAELFENVRFPKGKFYEDTFVYHVLAYRAGRIALTGHDGYYYLSRRESILGQAKYTDRYFDMAEAMYERMTFLLAHGVAFYGKEACLSLYAVTANAEKHIVGTAENAPKFEQLRRWYRLAYKHLMKQPHIGVKQRLRLILLRYCPPLHNKLY